MARRSAPARASSRPRAISELLPNVLSELGLDDAALALTLHRVWDTAIGPELAPHCRPEGARRGVIQARVRDSSWMLAVQMRKHELVERLSSALAPAPVLDLRLQIGIFEDEPS